MTPPLLLLLKLTAQETGGGFKASIKARQKRTMQQIKRCNASADGLLVLANHTFVCYMAAAAGRKVGEDEWRGDTPTFDEESCTMMIKIALQPEAVLSKWHICPPFCGW